MGRGALHFLKDEIVIATDEDLSSVLSTIELAIFFYNDSLRGSIEVSLGGIHQPFIGRRTGAQVIFGTSDVVAKGKLLEISIQD